MTTTVNALTPRPDLHDVATLSNATQDLVAASISENTRIAYTGALRRLDQALAGEPLTEAALAEHLADLHDAGASPATAGQVVAAVKFRCKLAGRPVPTGPATARVLAGIRRSGSDRGRGQVAGVRWDQADCAATLATDKADLAGLRDGALLAIMSDAMLRVSEAAALNVDDVGESTITVRRSKTDQEAAGALLYLGPSTTARITAWREAAGIEEGPLFRRVGKGGRVLGRLTARSVRNIVAARARAAGVSGRVSGHSLRVGSAQSLASAGAGLAEMQVAGRWASSSMPARYARGELAGRGAVARLRYGR